MAISFRMDSGAGQARHAQGRCEGRKPYGTREGEQSVIARMRELRKTGLGFDRIAAALNSEGLKPRAGERWHGVVVNRILANVAS